MLEPKKPADPNQQDAPTETPKKEYNPTPAEGSPEFEPGTLDPKSPSKE